MIASLLGESLAGVLAAGFFWLLGYSYSLYRAVSWVERSRLWAARVCAQAENDERTEWELGCRPVDAMGWN